MIQQFILIFVTLTSTGMSTGIVEYTDKASCMAAAQEVRKQTSASGVALVVLTCTAKVSK